MSIATAITTAQGRVANAYTAVSTKGGTLPATQNLVNLPDAILSIPSGGSGGDLVYARAVAGTELYTADDKVILIPTSDLYDESVFTYSIDKTSHADTNAYLVSGWGDLDYKKGAVMPLYPYNADGTKPIMRFEWNTTYTSMDLVSSLPISTTNSYNMVRYANGYKWVMPVTADYYGNPRPSYIGIEREDGSVITVSSGSQNMSFGSGFSCVKNFAKILGEGSSGNNIYYYNESTGAVTQMNFGSGGTAAGSIPSFFNGTWYIINGSTVATVSAPSTKIYNCTGGYSYYGGPAVRFFDDNVDYYFEYDYSGGTGWNFRKVTKSTSEWSKSSLPNVMATYLSCISSRTTSAVDALRRWDIISRDHGDKVESFMWEVFFGYDSSGYGNKVAHFMFDKATETVERLPDVFLDVPDTYTYCGGVQVNWDLGLIGVTVMSTNTAYTEFTSAVYIKKLDDMAGIYKYYAFPNQNQYYLNNSLTGFVTQNEGTDMFDNTVLEVSTVEDPTAPPWSNVGKVFGMTISVNKGNI